MEIQNAKIESTMLDRESHGIPTCYVQLTFSGIGQAFGGYDLRFHGIGMILGIMDAVGVSQWQDLSGQYCRVKRDGQKLLAIGHIVEDKWYTPEAG